MDENINATQTNEETQDSSVVADEPKQPTPEQAEEPKQEQQAPQTKEENSRFARERREKEMNEKIESARNEARTQAIIEAIGENPYTHKPLEDAKDVETYLIMKQIDKDGGDPLGDYPEYQKKSEAKKEEKHKADAKAEEDRVNDIKDFVSKYPNVDLNKLGEDADFEEYVGNRLGSVPLAKLYADYQAFLTRIGGKSYKEAKEKEIIAQAKSNASVGSLESVSSGERLYTLEELKNMSMADIEKNWEKVQQSRKKYNI